MSIKNTTKLTVYLWETILFSQMKNSETDISYAKKIYEHEEYKNLVTMQQPHQLCNVCGMPQLINSGSQRVTKPTALQICNDQNE